MAKKFDLSALMGAGEVPKLDKVNCPKGAGEGPLEDAMQIEEIALDHIRDADGCFGCKFALEGEPCYCEDCKDDDEAQCNESCPWWGDPCGICDDKNCWEWIGVT